ncbi:hypothetical protein KCV00_g344, partial [Aureobasidium melanogenum]
MTPTESRVVFVRCRGDAGEHREEHQAHLRRTRIGQHRAMTMGNKERRIAYPLVEIFVPLPAMNPRNPSSRHILPKALPIDILYSSRPTL